MADEAPAPAAEEAPDLVALGELHIETLVAGDGTNFPEAGQTCRVHYVGQLEDGTVFDSSRDRGDAFMFKLGTSQVIRGWDEGVARMNLGQVVRIVVPPEYAYGSRGFPPIIPPNATLTYEIELISFE